MSKLASSKEKRVKKIRSKIASLKMPRLQAYKTGKNLYLQLTEASGGKVVAAASSLEKTIKEQDFGSGKLKLASELGKLLANRALDKGVVKVAFDRSGFKYHGLIKALADGARHGGLVF